MICCLSSVCYASVLWRNDWNKNDAVITSGGASPSKQPGHFQVTKVVRRSFLPFSIPSLLPAFPFFLPFPSLSLEEEPLKSSQGSGERCKFPQRGLGQSPSRNRFWCLLALKSDIWCQQIKWFSWKSNEHISFGISYFLQNHHYNQTLYHWQHTSTYRSLSPLRLLAWFWKARRKKKRNN